VHRSRDRRAVVAVWVTGPRGRETSALLRHLDPVEAARAAALPPDQAARFVLARALLRGVLGERLGCAPRDVDLRVACASCGGPHGRVTVAGPPGGEPLHVSLTRSGPRVAVALTTAGPVGVDVASPAAVGAAPLAGVALSAAERRRHDRSRPGPDRGPDAGLAHVWVSKEAALKALGTGLLVDPADLELGGAGGPRGGVAHHRGTVLAIAPLLLGPGVVGAVAVAAPSAASPGPRWVARRAGRPVVDVRVHDGAAVLARLAAG